MNRFWNRIKTILARRKGYALFFIVGLAVLIGAETGVLYYLNEVYLHENDQYKITRLTSSALTTQKHHSVTLDSHAQDVQVSHDGDYLAYLDGSTIHIVNMTNGQSLAVPSVSGRTVATFKWVYDRDRLTIVEKSTGSDDSDSSSSSRSRHSSSRDDNSSNYPFAELYSYDMSDETIQLVRDYMNDHDVKISLNSLHDTISDLDMSTETVVTYLKITGTTGYSRLWEANITVKNAALSDLPTHKIGKIQSLKSTDDLLFEDSSTGTVYLYSAKTERYTTYSINGQTNLRLLGFDSQDREYFGIMQNNLVTSIAYGDPIQKSWQTLTLSTPTDPSNISVAYSGSVYVNDPDKTAIKELAGGKSVDYAGQLLCVYDNGFYSLNSSTVTDHPIASTASNVSSSTSTSVSISSGTSEDALTSGSSSKTSSNE